MNGAGTGDGMRIKPRQAARGAAAQDGEPGENGRDQTSPTTARATAITRSPCVTVSRMASTTALPPLAAAAPAAQVCGHEESAPMRTTMAMARPNPARPTAASRSGASPTESTRAAAATASAAQNVTVQSLHGAADLVGCRGVEHLDVAGPRPRGQ